MNKDKIKEIVMGILNENERNFSPKSERDLVWYSLRGIISTWIYMHGPTPLASVWWSGDSWRYSVTACNQVGDEESREDAMARVEAHLARGESAYIEALDNGD